MNAHVSELFRLLNNLIRIGTIAEVDGTRARVKIGNNTTQWRPWINTRAGNARTWWQPSIGEQCLVFSPGGEMTDCIILVGIYSDEHPAPSQNPALHVTRYPDGAIVQYDHEEHALAATLPDGGSAVLTAPASVTVNTQAATVHAHAATIDAPQTTCTGNLTVHGLITGQGGLAISAGAGGGPAATIQGELNATGDVKAGDISLQGHHHDEQGDNAPTSAAKP